MKKLFLFTVAVVLLQCYSYTQTTLNDFKFYVYYETTSTDTAVFDSLCTRMCKIKIPDTTNVAYIKVKVGTSKGASDILQQNFAWDVTTGLPNGLSYKRKKKHVYLGLLETTRSDNYYYQVQIQDINGNLSTPKNWN